MQLNYNSQTNTDAISLLHMGIKNLVQDLISYQNIQKSRYTNQAKIKKWALYGKLWGVAHNSSKENQIVKENKEVEQIQNLIKSQRKGRPSGSGRPGKQLRIQSSLEEQHLAITSQNINNNSMVKKYKCSFCSSFSHTKARCPLNANKNRQPLQQLSL
ncbi:hypothetical protein C2G38_2311972 [Gigaspora rosea]|uniref:Uncharacterized protein n=1 Tax=Gigaspora rosea TaxID=44941 RepID=A0A397V5Z2_9GLOM|nr:hypothetical protein C2G38_2311972 [Gigaspora rosea]